MPEEMEKRKMKTEKRKERGREDEAHDLRKQDEKDEERMKFSRNLGGL